MAIALDGRTYAVESPLRTPTLYGRALGSSPDEIAAAPGLNPADNVGRQVAAQLEQLLYRAYQMGITDLQDRLHAFIAANMAYSPRGLLTLRLLEEMVLSWRVMAAVYRRHARAAWAERICAWPADGAELFEHDSDSDDGSFFASVHSRLQRPWLGLPAGKEVTVTADLLTGKAEWSLRPSPSSSP